MSFLYRKTLNLLKSFNVKLKNIINSLVALMLFCSLHAYATKGITSDEAGPHFSSLNNQETIEDMRVKILGGYLRMNRTWNGSEWVWNQRWSNLTITKEVAKPFLVSGGGNFNSIVANFEEVLIIYREGQVYRQSSVTTDAIVYENQLNQFITKRANGFEWSDRHGNGIYYDLNGKITGYYDLNNINVYIEYDANGYITQIKDTNHNVAITYTYEPIPGAAVAHNAQNQEYAPQRLIKLTDYTGRSVNYSWNAAKKLEKVTDVRGEDWVYTYDDKGLLTQLTDPDNRITRYNIALTGRFVSRYDADGRGVTYSTSYDKNTELYYSSKLESGGQLQETWYNAMGLIARQASSGDDQGSVEYVLSDNSLGVQKIMRNYSHRVEYWYSGYGVFMGKVIIDDYELPKVKNEPIYIKYKKVMDSRGNVTVHEFNQWKNEVKVTYPDGATISRTWHTKFSLPLTETNEKGVITAYEYDENGNVLTLTEAKGLPEQRITRYTYDQYGQLETKTTGESTANNTALATTYYEYDQYGNTTKVTDPEGNITHYSSYDALGNAGTTIDARANASTTQYVWQKTYDAAGDVLTDLDPYGKGKTYTYSKSGDLRTIVAADGSSATLSSNASGLPLTVTDANGKVTKLEYDKANRPTFLTDANGNKTQTVYDDQGRVQRTIDGENNTTQFSYAQNVLREIQYPTFKDLYDYDNRNRISQTVQQANNRNYIRKRIYDQQGNVAADTDAQENNTSYEYDSLNRVIKITDANNGVTQFSYDARNNLLQVKDPENRVTIYTYDRNNRLLSETKDGDQNTTRQRRYTYDENDNLISTINPEQEKTVYEYDRANRLVKNTIFAHKNHTTPVKRVNYSINNKSQLGGWSQQLSSSIPEGVTPTADIISLGETYTYTNLGQLESVTANFGGFTKTYSYSYYPNGLKKTYTNSEGITYTYYYNKNNQLIAMQIPNNGQLSYGEFKWLFPQTLVLPGGQKITYSYDDFLQVKERVLKDSSQQTIASALYEYDLENNIKKIAANDGDYTFTYDNLYRLKTTDVPIKNSANDESFDYDGVGNRTALTTGTVTSNLTYNNKNQLTNTSADVAFTYTASGHTKTQTQNGVVTEYIYNHEERLIAVKRAGNVIAEYAYNPQGQRVKKTVGGNVTWYLYNQNGLAAEYSSAGNLIKEYQFHPQKTWMTDPLFMRTATSEVYYYHNDHLGTPQQLVNSSGQVVWQAQYSAFGRANITVNTIENNLRFPGQYFDNETGLHQNYFRDYDPASGRYIESDPMGLYGGINTYAYVEGNPIMLIDPLGLWAWGDPLPDGLVNASAGFGDGVSLGGTALVRELMGTNDAVDFTSPEYAAGLLAGVAVTSRGYATGAELKIGSNLRIAPWGNRTGHPIGRYPHYHRRGKPDANGNTPPGQGIGRHRPWEIKPSDKCGSDRL